MNATVQSNAGKGNYANLTEQTGENTALKGLAEVDTPGTILQHRWQPPTTEKLIANFFDANNATDTINEITGMLRAWLTETDRETGELKNDPRTLHGSNTLSSAFRLINLVVELSERNVGLHEDE